MPECFSPSVECGSCNGHDDDILCTRALCSLCYEDIESNGSFSVNTWPNIIYILWFLKLVFNPISQNHQKSTSSFWVSHNLTTDSLKEFSTSEWEPPPDIFPNSFKEYMVTLYIQQVYFRNMIKHIQRIWQLFSPLNSYEIEDLRSNFANRAYLEPWSQEETVKSTWKGFVW